MEKRIKILGIAVIIMMILLALRVGYIQIIGHRDLSESALRQQTIQLDGISTRGVIRDRNGIALTDSTKEYIIVIKKDRCDSQTITALKWLKAVKRNSSSDDYVVYRTSNYDSFEMEMLKEYAKADILEVTARYSRNQPASALIGYASSNRGISGLERRYDKILRGEGKLSYIYADAEGNFLKNSRPEGRKASSDIVTTLDYNLQKHLENVISKTGKKAAVVVLDLRDGGVLAAAQKGEFNMITEGVYAPGSLFKTVVAAAAFEGGITRSGNPVDEDTLFCCRGQESACGTSYGCLTGGPAGHGNISLGRAMAESCNSTFIQLGKLTGAAKIIAQSYRLGLGRTVLEGFPGEAAGNVTTEAGAAGAGIGNLSIGQGDMLVTPLQMAKVTAAVAGGGRELNIHLRKGERSGAGRRVLSFDSAEKVRKMMIGTMRKGSGKSSAFAFSTGGKTGSAEAVSGGRRVVNCWFSGFAPADSPRFVVTVLVEDGRSGGESALPVFDEAVRYLYRMPLSESAD